MQFFSYGREGQQNLVGNIVGGGINAKFAVADDGKDIPEVVAEFVVLGTAALAGGYA